MKQQPPTPYIEIKFQTSKFAWGISTGSCLLIVYLTSNANILDWYKFIILAAICATMSMASYRHYQQVPTKIDLLLWINKAILWQDKRLVSAQIANLQPIANLVVVLTLKTQFQQRRVLVFYDSTCQAQYKQLMRHIRWHN